MSEKQSWWQLLAIQTGGTLSPPILLIGGLLAEKYGWNGALLTIALGNLALLLLALLFIGMSSRRPLSTVEQATYYFGLSGKCLFGSLMILSVLIWFGIQLNVMSKSFRLVDSNLLNVVIGIFITSFLCFGISAVKRLSCITTPLLALALLQVAFNSEPSEFPSSEISIAGVFMVIGANIAAVIDLPTFFRHAKSPLEARKCIFFLYGIILPLVEISGIFLSMKEGGLAFDAFVLLSGWQTNNSNLYSAIASSCALFKGVSLPVLAVGLGAIGIGIACLNPLGHLEGVLDWLVVAIGGMGLLLVGRYVFEKRSYS